MLEALTLRRVQEAADRIQDAPSVAQTPLIEHQTPRGRRLWLKAESLQPIGAFKIRGATNMIRSLPPDTVGVVAHSSGNHAQAVARAAREAGLPAVVVMPSDAPTLKRARTEADGAEVIEVGPDSDERAQRADLEVERRGWILVPPFDHPDIAAGQGTAALELHEALGASEPSRFYCPTSGGGLMAGCATVLHRLRPNMALFTVEPEDGNDTALSLAKGERQSVPPPKTVADGLRVRTPGRNTFPVLKARVHGARIVTDEEILDAMAYALRLLRLVLEPAGAAGLAAALKDDAQDAVVLLSGGNTAPDLLQSVLSRAPSGWEAP